MGALPGECAAERLLGRGYCKLLYVIASYGTPIQRGVCSWGLGDVLLFASE